MSLTMGSLYAIMAFVGVAVAGVVLNRNRATKRKEHVDTNFSVLLIFFICFCLADGIWGLFFTGEGKTHVELFGMALSTEASWWGYYLATYAFHLMSALSAFVWSGYLCNFTGLKGATRNTMTVLRVLLLAPQIVILVSNIWTGNMFVIKMIPFLSYITMPLRTVLFWCQFANYVICAICIIVLIIAVRDSEKRRLYSTAMVFTAVPLLAGVLQLLWPDAPMYSVGFTVSAVTIYSFNITTQREKYLTRLMQKENDKLLGIASGLSEDAQIILHVDMTTNEYEAYGRTGDKLVQMRGGEDFFNEQMPNIRSLVVEEDCETLLAAISKDNILRELADKQSFSHTYRQRLGGDVRYCQLKVIRSAEKDGQDRILIGAFDDDARIRAEMEQQEQLRTAREAAEQASQAKTNFLFNMSHDIRTPMNAILGFTQMAEKHPGDPEKVAEDLAKVRTAGNHLLSIINDILDMSRIESGKVQLEEKPVSLDKSFGDLLAIVNPMAAAKDITLVWEGERPEHDLIYADEMHLNRVFMNILTNAVKYTPAGGRIACMAEEFENELPGCVDFRFTFRDNGIGMSEEYLKHIFETFSRERNTTTSGIQGTGLGMAITKALVDLMKGSIIIESKEGEGTTVILYFTFKLADAVEQQRGDAPMDTEFLRGKRVLLVEDNELNREIATDTLEDMGVVVDEAEDGTVAVEKCRELDLSKPYDFILMDVQMPIMDGYTATAEIRKMPDPYFAGVPIIAMTANVFAEDMKRSEEAGMNAHLGKPIDLPKMVATLRDLL